MALATPTSMTAFDRQHEWVRRGYDEGRNAGHQDAIERIEPIAWDLLADLNLYRWLRNRSPREMPDHRTYDQLAKATRLSLIALLAARRALKGGTR